MAASDWDSSLYEDRHSFVWKAGEDLLALLHPKQGQRILDLGCGTGQLTAKIAEAGAIVTGMDSSPSMVAQARQNYPRLKFSLADARNFSFHEPFDAVFSNAALHWISEAESVILRVAAALKLNGRFVLEMGAKGNIERIRHALEDLLTQRGTAFECPWFYPSAGEYIVILERQGFEIEYASTFPRWTRLEHPERGLREWVEMFASAYVRTVPTKEHEALMKALEDRLRPDLYCDGAWWADYRRLRVAAVMRARS